jgi:hypothetical protein
VVGVGVSDPTDFVLLIGLQASVIDFLNKRFIVIDAHLRPRMKNEIGHQAFEVILYVRRSISMVIIVRDYRDFIKIGPFVFFVRFLNAPEC